MRFAADTIRWLRRVAILSLAPVAIVSALFLIDGQGVGPAAGEWKITQVTNGREAPTIGSKVGDRIRVMPDGYVSFPEWHGRFGVLGRGPCGWNCFILTGLRITGRYRIVLAGDLGSLTLTSADGFAMVAERHRTP